MASAAVVVCCRSSVRPVSKGPQGSSNHLLCRPDMHRAKTPRGSTGPCSALHGWPSLREVHTVVYSKG